MNADVKRETSKLSDATIAAMNGLPILSQLEFVRNILCGAGGSRDNFLQDIVLITATEVLTDVIKVLNRHPKLARMRDFPEP